MRRGLLRSGGAASYYADLVVEEFERRVDTVRDEIRQALADIAAVPTEFEKESLRFFARAEVGNLAQAFATTLDGLEVQAGESPSGRVTQRVEDLTSSLVARCELLTAGVESRALSRAAAAPTIHVGGNVGAIQTGQAASANVSQGSPRDDGLIAELREALTQIEAYFQSHEGSNSNTAAKVAELRDEVQQPIPDRDCLRRLAVGVGTAVQTAANLKPAYAIVRAGLSHIGVSLPDLDIEPLWPQNKPIPRAAA